MPKSTMHPLLQEGLDDIKAAQAQQLEGLTKILTVLGSAVTSTPLTEAVEETKKTAKKAPTKKTKEPAPKAETEEPEVETNDGPTIQDIRKMLQSDVPRKVGIEMIEEFVPKGKRAILSNVPKNLYEKFAEAIQAKSEELAKS